MSKAIITPEAIISFPRLFTPNENDKYEASLIFPEGTDISELKTAAGAVAFEKFGDKAAAMFANGQLHSPFNPGAKKVHLGYPEDSTFINARSTRQPGVVAPWADENDPTKPAIIKDERVVTAGARVFGLVSFFYYDREGNKGIGVGLEGIQLIRKPTAEERLDGRVAAEDAFSVDADAVPDLGDLGTEEESEAPAAASAATGSDDLSDLL
jgi:hypothetical protein